MKRALQKLVRNGNATQVAIARPILIDLGWLPGERVIVELHGDELHIRKPRAEDFDRSDSRSLLHGPTVGVHP